MKENLAKELIKKNKERSVSKNVLVDLNKRKCFFYYLSSRRKISAVQNLFK